MAAVRRAVRAIFDIDTLDTRLTTPANVSYRTVVEARSARDGVDNHDLKPLMAEEVRIRASAGPPRWRTLEFYGYYAYLGIVAPLLFWVPYSVSRPSDPRYHKFERFLEPGWIPGRKIDNSDAQYHLFRENLPYLALLMTLHPLLRRAYNRLGSFSSAPSSPRASTARLAQRASFDAIFAIVFLLALHGLSTLKILAILILNYRIAKRVPRQYVPALSWVFNIAILFANELTTGYSFAALGRLMQHMLPGLKPDGSGLPPLGALENFGAWLDQYRGLVGRWEILFNLTVLRLISFNMDYYWSQDPHRAPSLEKKQLDMANLSETDRVTIPAPPETFTFLSYLGYAIYAPLYLTGPIITFNDYIWQSRHRPATIENRRTLLYGVRFLVVLLTMELVLHFDYVGAISKASPRWADYRPSELALLAYFNLHVIWLKLLIPWRQSRLWALMDGIDPPENMIRCVSDNYSTLLFWRGWHRSYNRWLVRYLYVPLGGSSFTSPLAAARSVLTYMLSFTFVALWHDIQLNLLLWGWLIVLFMLPEMVVGAVIPKEIREGHSTPFRMVSCAAAVGSIFTMMAANLVGFAFGWDGLQAIMAGIFDGGSGLAFLLLSYATLFAGVQIMFEVRQAELRRGISLRC